jgi:hypothetical protein
MLDATKAMVPLEARTASSAHCCLNLEADMKASVSSSEAHRANESTIAEVSLYDFEAESAIFEMEEVHAEILDVFQRSTQKPPLLQEDKKQNSLHDKEFESPSCLKTTDMTVAEGSYGSVLDESSNTSRPRRSDSQDRWLNEAVHFFEALGSTPPSHTNGLLQTIIDDDDRSQMDEEEGVLEIHVPQDSLLSSTAKSCVGLSRTCDFLFPRSSRQPRHVQKRSKDINPVIIFHKLPSLQRTQSYIYQGIQSNPPEITIRGISRGNYSQLHRKAWLEVADPYHRYGKNLRLYYHHWGALGYPTNRFFDWLDGIGAARGGARPELAACPREQLDTDTVLYITDPTVTQRYAVKLECDCSSGIGLARVTDMEGRLIQTGVEGWIFVLRDNVLYGAPKVVSIAEGAHSKQRFHHSSFFGGKAVSAAGIFVTDSGGILTHVFPHSGHYRPGEADLQRMLFFLYQHGLDLKAIQVDTQQLVHMSRNQELYKLKKIDSLCLQPAASVAHYLSHKARCIGYGLFGEIHALRIDKNVVQVDVVDQELRRLL